MCQATIPEFVVKRNQAFPSAYWKAADLEDVQPVLTIAAVGNESFGSGEDKRVVSFRESPKRLTLNRTNWTKIAEITGEEDDENWRGASVKLVSVLVPFKGDTVPAVRVERPDSATPEMSTAGGGDDLPF